MWWENQAAVRRHRRIQLQGTRSRPPRFFNRHPIKLQVKCSDVPSSSQLILTFCTLSKKIFWCVKFTIRVEVLMAILHSALYSTGGCIVVMVRVGKSGFFQCTGELVSCNRYRSISPRSRGLSRSSFFLSPIIAAHGPHARQSIKILQTIVEACLNSQNRDESWSWRGRRKNQAMREGSTVSDARKLGYAYCTHNRIDILRLSDLWRNAQR